jgi:hypothetical protein
MGPGLTLPVLLWLISQVVRRDVFHNFGLPIENNIFVGTDNIPAIACNTNPSGGTPATVVYSHNDALNAGGNPPNACNTNATGSANRSVDPQFLNPPADNFHIISKLKN